MWYLLIKVGPKSTATQPWIPVEDRDGDSGAIIEPRPKLALSYKRVTLTAVVVFITTIVLTLMLVMSYSNSSEDRGPMVSNNKSERVKQTQVP